MARMRTVKPALRTSAVVAAWPREVRYAWVLLWGYLDDDGRGLDIPKAIAGDCFPLDDDVDAAKMNGWLAEMNGAGPLCRYSVDGRAYLHAVNWTEHQKPNRPTQSKLPMCPKHRDQFSEPLSEHAVSDSALEGLRGRGFEGLRVSGEPLSESPADPSAPPPRTCERHPNGTTRACRACQRAREQAEAWEAERRSRTAAAAKCPTHGGDNLATNCGPCRSERIERRSA